MTVKNGFPGFKFGADPEVFIVNEAGKYVSAAGLIPGTKDHPFKVEGGALQVDGMAAEFNIDPAETFSQFNRNIERVLAQLQERLPKGYTYAVTPSVVFDEDVFMSAPDEAKQLGCMPDFDAWTGEINPVPEPINPFMRCAGGHLHVGWQDPDEAATQDAEHIANCQDLVKQFDWHLGHWSLRFDADANRRQLYGKAGAHRVKPYGVEYRTLSNFWIVTRERRLYVWNRMQNALNDMRTRFLPETNVKSNDRLVAAINSSTRDLSLEKNCRYPLVAEGVGY